MVFMVASLASEPFDLLPEDEQPETASSMMRSAVISFVFIFVSLLESGNDSEKFEKLNWSLYDGLDTFGAPP